MQKQDKGKSGAADDALFKGKKDSSSNGADKKESIEKPLKQKQIKGKATFVCAGMIYCLKDVMLII